MLKVNNKDTRTTPVASGVVLISLLLTLNIFQPCSSVSIVNFEHVITGRERSFFKVAVYYYIELLKRSTFRAEKSVRMSLFCFKYFA